MHFIREGMIVSTTRVAESMENLELFFPLLIRDSAGNFKVDLINTGISYHIISGSYLKY